MPKYFVYVNGLRGPEAQIWDDEHRYENQKKVQTLFKQALKFDEHLHGLNALKERYPMPVSEAKV